MKTNSGLVEFAKMMVGECYWYGCYTQTATRELLDDKSRQYPAQYVAKDFEKQFGHACMDCIGLIKGFMWRESIADQPVYDRNTDVSTNGMYARCERKGKIATFPKHPGMLVFKGDLKDLYHVGVYIGGDTVIEAKGHAYGVVRSSLSAGKWTYWAQCLYLDDDTAELAVDAPFQMSFGDSGKHVQILQMALLMHNYDIGRWGCDGEFYKATDAAVKLFQADHHLEVDGIVGTQTWRALIG